MRMWLARIVVRVAINHRRSFVRRLKRLVFLADLQPITEEPGRQEFDPADPAHRVDREAMMDVRKFVNGLPDEFRLPLLMLAVDGMTIPEIAAILEIPEGTVKSRVFYGRKRLKDAMGKTRLVL